MLRIQSTAVKGTSATGFALVLVTLLVAVASASEAPVIASAEQRTALDLTVYNSDLALVREVRDVALPAGVFFLEFRDVPARIRPTTLRVEAQGKSELHILEQNYEFDLMSKEKVLEKYVGREITWLQEEGGRVTGRLLGLANGPVYEVDGEVVFSVPGRIVLPSLPQNLRARPTLVWKAESQHAGQTAVETSYLTAGLSWSTDYVLQLDSTGTWAGLQAWVSMNNQSGAAYEDARILLIAGDVHRAPGRGEVMMMDAAPATKGVRYGGVVEESLYDYHLYTLPQRSTLKMNQIKQISMFEADGIETVRHYRLQAHAGYFRGGGKQPSKDKVQMFYSFENREQNGLGIPLPAGVFRVYGQAASGSRQLLGEDRIDHTPVKEEIELQVGTAFDLVAERVRADYTRVSDRVHRTSYEITIRNHKEEDVTVEVLENVGGDWTVLSSSLPYNTISAAEIEFLVPVPADGETVLTYQVEVRF